MPRLGINIDHVATVRQARKEGVPNLIEAARTVIAAGADGITAHLREDRRHIQDEDMELLRRQIDVPLNMEMSIAAPIVEVALRVKPHWACLVPEKRQELTTEGGLDVVHQFDAVRGVVEKIKGNGTRVSLFVDADLETVRRSRDAGADAIEIHTGAYARAFSDGNARAQQLRRIAAAAAEAQKLGLIVNAGHGLDLANVPELLSTFRFHEFNIGFSIIARALFVGLPQAVSEMKMLLTKGKQS